MSCNQIIFVLYIYIFPFLNIKWLRMPYLFIKLLFILLITYAYTEGKLNLNCIFPWHSMTPSTLASDSWPCSPSASPSRTTELAVAKAISESLQVPKTVLTPRALAHPAKSLFNLVMKSHLDYLTKNRSSESSSRKTCWIVSHSNSFCFGNVPSLWKTSLLREFVLLVAYIELQTQC